MKVILNVVLAGALFAAGACEKDKDPADSSDEEVAVDGVQSGDQPKNDDRGGGGKGGDGVVDIPNDDGSEDDDGGQSNDDGAGDDDGEESTDTTPPGSSSGIVAIPGDEQVDLSWNGVAGATGYLVVARVNSAITGTPNQGTTYSAGQTIGDGSLVVYAGAATSFNHTGLDNLDVHYYRVFPYDQARNYAAPISTQATPFAPVQPWALNGTASAMASKVQGNTLYVAGDFSFVGKPQVGSVAVSLSNGKPLNNWPSANGYVYAVESDGNGGWYVGGAFSEIGGQPRVNFARINADGSIHALDLGLNGTSVQSLLLSDTTLYVGGDFTTVDSTARNGIFALDTTSGTLTAFDADLDAALVAGMAMDGSNLFIAGYFTASGATPLECSMAKVNAASGAVVGAFNPTGCGIIPYWSDLVVSGSYVYVGGMASYVGGGGGGDDINYLGRLDKTNGTWDTGWQPNPDSDVTELEIAGNHLFVAGNFTSLSGESRYTLAEYDISGAPTLGADASVVPGDFFAGLTALKADPANARLYVGGGFKSIFGQPRYGFAALNLDAGDGHSLTGSVGALDVATSEYVHAIAVTATHVMLGGGFNLVGRPRNGIAAIDIPTGKVKEWNPDLGAGAVAKAVEVVGNTVYIGGLFTSVGGSTRNNFAAVTTSGTLLPIDPSPDDAVLALHYNYPHLFIGGSFNNIAGEAYPSYVAFHTGNDTYEWLGIDAMSDVRSIASSGNMTFAGGNMPGVNLQGLTYTPEDGFLGMSGMLGTDGPVERVLFDGPYLHVGGDFDNVYNPLTGEARQNFAAFDMSAAGLDWQAEPPTIPMTPPFDGVVRAMTPTTNHLFVGGDFLNVDGEANSRLATLNRIDLTYVGTVAPSFSANVVSLVNYFEKLLFAGGAFTTFDGKPQSGLAVFDDSGIAP